MPLPRKQVDDVLGEDDAWENVDQTDGTLFYHRTVSSYFRRFHKFYECIARCPHCDHNKAYFMQIQIRLADKPYTTFYKCVSCKKRWNDK